MAKMLGTRQDGIVTVVSLIPSFTWTKGIPLPVPYPVIKPTLTPAVEVSKDVKYNKKWAYIKDSDTTRVIGDQLGLDNGGFFSITLSDKSYATSYSNSVFADGRNAVRGGDIGYMNSNNTIGYHIIEPPTPKPAITDTGKVAEAEPAPEMPSFMEFF